MSTHDSISRRQVLAGALAGAGSALLLSPLTAIGAPPANPRDGVLADIPLPTGDIRDWDFFVGQWTGVNRRLKQRWVGSNDWDVFPNTLSCGSHLGGVVNLDYEVDFPTKGWSGMTVRTFDTDNRRWSLYWINSRTGTLFPPVVGGFTGDRGEFFGNDLDEGRPVKVRFRWTRHRPGAARWEQAFSLDGRQWETNWICEHTRVGERPVVCRSSQPEAARGSVLFGSA